MRIPLLRTLLDDDVRADLEARLARVEPDALARWGRMNAGQMLCHLTDLFRHGMGEREAELHGGWLHHTVMRWWAVTVPLRWPHGLPTGREFDQERDGTPPGQLEADRAELVTVMRRFADPATELRVHPLLGRLSREEWGRWGFRHVDHHLRQFGV